MSKKKPALTAVPAGDGAVIEATVAPDDLPMAFPAPVTKHTRPALGDHFMYLDDSGHVAPAVVTGLNEDGTVALHVFYRTGVAGHPDIDNVSPSDGQKSGWFIAV